MAYLVGGERQNLLETVTHNQPKKEKENIMQTYLTRKDADCGAGLFDSIKWALEIFDREDDQTLNFAVLHGHETHPSKIEFFKEEPNYDTKPDLILTEEEKN